VSIQEKAPTISGELPGANSPAPATALQNVYVPLLTHAHANATVSVALG
jgi:hypothetical protein